MSQKEFYPAQGNGAKDWFRHKMEPKQYTHNHLNNNSLVLDLGAFHGTYTREIWKRYGCNIMAFEALPSFFKTLQNNFSNMPKIKCFEFGLGAKDEDITLNVDGISTSRYIPRGTPQKCHLKNVVDFFEENDISNVDLMAINIEGGEYDLLDKMIESGLHARVHTFQIQFHDLFPDSVERRKRIQDELSKTHNLVYNYTFCWEKWERKN